MKRSHHGHTVVHAQAIWQALKHPLGRKLKWQSAARMAYNWMIGRPIMRRPVALKIVYKLNEELQNQIHADMALEMASPNFQMPLGTHVVVQDDQTLLVRQDKDYPEINWLDDSTWPENLVFPEGPTATVEGMTAAEHQNIFGDTIALTVNEIASDVSTGITTFAQAADYLRQTGNTWLQQAQVGIHNFKYHDRDGERNDNGCYLMAYLTHRIEHVVFNVVASKIVKLIPFIIPGKYTARNYGRVRTSREEYYRNYFYWGQGPGYNGHPCIHLPPGRPAWSEAQFVFKRRLYRFIRRKNPKDKRCKAFNKIKVRIPPLAGKWTAKAGRPKIGRRYRKRVGKKIVEQMKWSIEHPLHKRLAQVEQTLKSARGLSTFLRNLKTGNAYAKIGEDVQSFFKEEMIHDLADDIFKNVKKTSVRRMNLYKRQVINSIGDPVVDYGVKVTAKVVRGVERLINYTPVFDAQDSKVDQFLFHATPGSFDSGVSDSDAARY